MRGEVKFFSGGSLILKRKYSGKEERKAMLKVVLSENQGIECYQITPILPRLGLNFRNALRKIPKSDSQLENQKTDDYG